MAAVLGWSSAASVELRRSLPAALVLLQIIERVREMRLDKKRRIGGIRGVDGDGKPRVSRCPEVLSGEIGSSFDLAA
jgi:hypothetical protein